MNGILNNPNLQGIARPNYTTPTFNRTTSTNKLERLYNNVWGIISDTRMTSKPDGTYVITGTMIKQHEYFDKFAIAGDWCTCIFSRSTGYYSLDDMMKQHGLCGHYDIQNGDDVYVYSPCECDDEDYCDEAMTVKETAADVLTVDDIKEFIEKLRQLKNKKLKQQAKDAINEL